MLRRRTEKALGLIFMNQSSILASRIQGLTTNVRTIELLLASHGFIVVIL